MEALTGSPRLKSGPVGQAEGKNGCWVGTCVEILLVTLTNLACQPPLSNRKGRVSFQEYIDAHPETIVLDPLPAIRTLLDRSKSYELIRKIEAYMKGMDNSGLAPVAGSATLQSQVAITWGGKRESGLFKHLGQEALEFCRDTYSQEGLLLPLSPAELGIQAPGCSLGERVAPATSRRFCFVVWNPWSGDEVS